MRKILLILFLLLLICGTCSATDRYKWLNSDDKVGYFFDTQTIKFAKDWNGRADYDVIDVWFKEIYTNEGVINRIKQREKDNLPVMGWKELSYEMFHLKFNTQNKKISNISFIAYNNDGIIIDNANYSDYWQDVIPSTYGENWMEELRKYALDNRYNMENK